MPGVINTPGGPTQQKDHIMCPNFEIISDLSTSDTFLLHFRVTVAQKTNGTRYYVKLENQLLLFENLGLKKKFIPHLKALNVSFNLKYQTLQKL